MKSIILERSPGRAGGEAVLTEMKTPRPGNGELLVEMKACGLCGTDVEKIRGQYTAAMPVLGHEAVGVVARLGSGVKGFEVGDRVFPHHHVPCHKCFYCRRGSETMCLRYRGSNIVPGGFSEFFIVPAWNVKGRRVLRLPSKVGFKECTMIEPVACCLRALDRCKVHSGESVLIVGAGPVGLAHAIILRAMKSHVMVSDISPERLSFAKKIGIKDALDPREVDVEEAAKRLSGGRGADLAIVASGSPKATVQALKAVRRGGRVCLFGVPVKGSVLDYDFSDVFNSEVSVITSYGATEAETARALSLIGSKKINVSPLLTHRYRLEGFGEALRVAAGGRGMKVVVTP